jgi:hypothetical protein
MISIERTQRVCTHAHGSLIPSQAYIGRQRRDVEGVLAHQRSSIAQKSQLREEIGEGGIGWADALSANQSDKEQTGEEEVGNVRHGHVERKGIDDCLSSYFFSHVHTIGLWNYLGEEVDAGGETEVVFGMVDMDNRKRLSAVLFFGIHGLGSGES